MLKNDDKLLWRRSIQPELHHIFVGSSTKTHQSVQKVGAGLFFRSRWAPSLFMKTSAAKRES